MGVSIVAGMRLLRLGITLVALSIFALLILDFVPGSWVSDAKYMHSIFSYVLLGLIFYVMLKFLGLSSLQYFRLPRFHIKTAVALLVASIFMILEVSNSDNVHLQPGVAINGIAFLFAIGFGEEIFSRGLVFGVLRRFGQWRAIVLSSFLFGLMHLNLYVGSNWDSWLAYWHVISAFTFGIFTCTLMIVTRSIWVAVLFHAISDWGIVFDKASSNSAGDKKYNPAFWDGITTPFFGGIFFVTMALLLLWLDRGSIPQWMKRVALKWKLIEPELAVT